MQRLSLRPKLFLPLFLALVVLIVAAPRGIQAAPSGDPDISAQAAIVLTTRSMSWRTDVSRSGVLRSGTLRELRVSGVSRPGGALSGGISFAPA